MSNRIFKKENMGKKIKKYRLLKDLSVMQLAEKSNLSGSFIGLVERGTRLIGLKNLVTLTNVLEVNINTILYDKQNSTKTLEHEKIETLLHFCKDLNSEEIDFVINSIRSLKKSNREYEKYERKKQENKSNI